MSEIVTLQMPRAHQIPRRAVSIRLLNGDDIKIGPCSTVSDLKAHAASHLKHFAPETYIFTLEYQPFVAPDHDAAPQSAIVIMVPRVTRDDAFWIKTLVAHANAGDGYGVASAMQILRAENPSRARALGSKGIQSCCKGRQTSVNAVSLLFNANADVDCGGVGEPTALWWAAKQGHADVVEYLLEVGGAGVDRPAFRGTTPLSIATRFRHVQIVEALLAFGANVNHANESGQSALMMFSSAAHAPITKLLISHGASLLQVNNNGETALSIAAYFGHRDLIEALLDAGADVNHPSTDGRTGIYIAAKHRRLNCVRLLLQWGADVDAVDQDGNSALLAACQEGHMEVVNALLDAKADINLFNIHGDSAAILASSNDHYSILDLLVRRGASIAHANADGDTVKSAARRRSITRYLFLMSLKTMPHEHGKNADISEGT
eukprot:GEMP01022463.1.p1 GENE.GEMP01022463.1~~GEMP01022463.1.p1  ORF type:complete len:434 (+),score=104.15 GEMP01022463.1:125-1426(+)